MTDTDHPIKENDSPTKENGAPREWWVSSPDGNKIGIDKAGVVWHRKPAQSALDSYPIIHVIEHSAYEKLREENERLDAQNKRLRVDSKLQALNECEARCDELREQVASLSEENKKLKEPTHDFTPAEYLTPYEYELLHNERKLKQQLESTDDMLTQAEAKVKELKGFLDYERDAKEAFKVGAEKLEEECIRLSTKCGEYSLELESAQRTLEVTRQERDIYFTDALELPKERQRSGRLVEALKFYEQNASNPSMMQTDLGEVANHSIVNYAMSDSSGC